MLDGGESSLACSVMSAAAAAAGVVKESDGVKAALQFVSTLLSELGKQPGPHAPVVSHGGALCRGLLMGAANTCPRVQLKQLANVLYTLIEGAGVEQAAAWLQASLSDAALPGGGPDGWLQDEEKLAFARAAVLSPPLSRVQFEALVASFAGVCRKEGAREALLSFGRAPAFQM